MANPPKNSLTPSADDFHASASQNGDGYPTSWSPSSLKLRRDKGTPGGASSPIAIKNQYTFSTQPKFLGRVRKRIRLFIAGTCECVTKVIKKLQSYLAILVFGGIL